MLLAGISPDLLHPGLMLFEYSSAWVALGQADPWRGAAAERPRDSRSALWGSPRPLPAVRRDGLRPYTCPAPVLAARTVAGDARGRRPGRGCFALYALRRTPMVHPQGCRKRCRAPRARSEAERALSSCWAALRSADHRSDFCFHVGGRGGPGRHQDRSRPANRAKTWRKCRSTSRGVALCRL